MQLLQSQKMEAMGRLAGGVAHDFNNLLTAIMGFGSLAMSELDPQHPTREKLKEVVKAGERAAALTRQLLVFSRQHVIQPEILDLNVVVDNLDKMLRRIIGEDVRLTTRRATEGVKVKADPGQIEQVLVNLAVNARDAMPTGGQLFIETDRVELGPADASQYPDVVPALHARVVVRDTGHGMDEGTLKRIFEPFFSTKGLGGEPASGWQSCTGLCTSTADMLWWRRRPSGALLSGYSCLSVRMTGKPKCERSRAAQCLGSTSRAARTRPGRRR